MLSKINTYLKQLRSGRANIDEVQSLNKAAIEQYPWDTETDIAVVGFGGAGVAAALEARDNGAEVLALERFNGGGSTRISGGIYYAGGGTIVQRAAQVTDSPQNMYNYLVQETGDAVHESTLKKFCNDSPGNLQWLMHHGVPFEASLCPFKTSYPSNQYYFYYSGNESFPPFSDNADPAPRGHRAHGKGVSGEAFFAPLQESALNKGVKLLTQHRATRLITNIEGEIVGLGCAALDSASISGRIHKYLYALLIYARYAAIYAPFITWLLRRALEKLEQNYSKTINVRTRKGVVISSGGFFFNRDMVERHAPKYLPGIPLGTIGDDGSGILMGEAVNGQTDMMDRVSDWRFINPPQAFTRGVLVDENGERVCNEMLYGAQLAEQITNRADGRAWLIIDARLFKAALKGIGPSKAMWFQTATALVYLFIARKKAGSLSQLAGKLNIPAQQLVDTIGQYNQLCQNSSADTLGKPQEYLAVLDTGPWYALDCRMLGKVRNPSITLGGLAVDETTGAVKSRAGGVIKGLYAAGRSAIGVASHSYVSGLSLADCVYSGRRAGMHASMEDTEQE